MAINHDTDRTIFDNAKDAVFAHIVGRTDYYRQWHNSDDLVEQAKQVLFEGKYMEDAMDVVIIAACNALSTNLHIFQNIGGEAVVLPTIATWPETTPCDIFLRYKRPGDSPENDVCAPHYDPIIKLSDEEIAAEIQNRQLMDKEANSILITDSEDSEDNIPDAVQSDGYDDISPPNEVNPNQDREKKILAANLKRSHKNQRSYLDYTAFAKLPIEEVERVPWNIDGYHIYQIKDTNVNNYRSKMADGRSWLFCTSKTKEDYILKRFGKCKGAYICTNNECSMFTCEGVRNMIKFKPHNCGREGTSLKVCSMCDYVVQPRHCPALKVMELNKLTNVMTVYHENNHICVEKANRPEKEAFLKNNMRISNITRAPKHVQMEMLSQCVAEGDFDKAYDVVKLIDDRELIEKMRYTGDIADHMNRASMSTLESFNSITQMKEKTDPKDKYLIYDLACKGLSGAQKSYVFTSSEGACRIALKMDLANQGNKEKPSELTQGYVYMDAMHSRTKDYKTLGMYLEHTGLKSIVTLAVMEAEREDTATIALFLSTFKKMLREYKGDPEYEFNPEGGFIVDEAGANFNAIREVFGPEMLKKTYTDHFHFFRCGMKNKVSVPEDERLSFERMYKRIKTCYTLQEYTKVSEQLDAICKRNNITWWDWWKPRRAHIVPIWRGFDTPGLNLAEVGHTTLKQRGKPLSLSRAVWRDILAMIAQDRRLDALVNNEAAFLGKGQSVYKKKKRQVRIERMFAQQACNFLETVGDTTTEAVEAEINAMETDETFLPTNSAKHKAPSVPNPKNVAQENRMTKRKKQGNQPSTRKRNKKAVQRADDEVEIGSFPSDASDPEDPIEVPMHIDRIEQQKRPSLVMLNKNRLVCYGCKLHYSEAERRKGQDMLFCVWLHREWMKRGELMKSPVKQRTFFHAYDMACLRQVKQLSAAKVQDIYLPNETARCLEDIHIRELKKRKLWNTLEASRAKLMSGARD